MTAAVAAAPRPAATPDACAQALAYEKTAASDGVSAQARYDSAVAGLTANQTCRDAQMHLVNEAYLLSMRAPAEHDLHIGDWQRDLGRANMLLTQCTTWPGIRGTRAGTDCATQRRYNDVVAKQLAAQPSPAPSRSPAPAGSAAPPRLGPALPPPGTPSAPPSPTPTQSPRA